MALFKKNNPLDDELEALYSKAHLIVNQTQNYDQAAARLMKEEGLNEHYARDVLNNLHTIKENKINFRRSMLLGFSSIAVSLGIAVVSFLAASAGDGGGIAIALYGLLAFGVTTILRAFIVYK